MHRADVEQSLKDVTVFLAALGNPHRDGLIGMPLVRHPDRLHCVAREDAFKALNDNDDDHYILEFARLRGDSLLFAHVLHDDREYVSTGMLPIFFPGQLTPRCRFGPSCDPPLDVPPLIL